jgi:mRNA-degrading endonuclease RelE of RelBE toxin-antitoxin system
MSYKTITTHRFEKELKRLVKKFPSLKKEFADLIAQLEEKPETGTLIGNQCYKIRLAISSKGKGKRGGARVITCVYTKAATVYLLTIYDKGEKDDLTDGDLADMINSLELE